MSGAARSAGAPARARAKGRPITGDVATAMLVAGSAPAAAAAATPAHGHNSFSRGEARGRIAAEGFGQIRALRKDAMGVWRGTAHKGGATAAVWLDYKGNVGIGPPEPAPLPPSERRPSPPAHHPFDGVRSMTTRTLTHLYDSYGEATRAVGALEAAGVPHADISIVGRDGAPATGGGGGVGTGASLGTAIGGGAGLLAGIGALAIPGVGPVVAAGWLVATLTGAGAGAAAGGLLGSLTGAGIHEDDAHVYAEGVRRGGTLLTVRADTATAARITPILHGSGAVDIAARRASYRADGWDRFDASGVI